MFNCSVDGKDISLTLRRRHFIFLKYEGFDCFVDSGKETLITELPDELKVSGELSRLVRYAIFQNDISLTVLALPTVDTFKGNNNTNAKYRGDITICKSYELIPGTPDVFISFNPVRKLSIEDFVYYLKAKALKMRKEIVR